MSRRNKEKRRARRFTRPTALPVNEEMAEALREQFAAFRAKFGRDPGPHDPVFFDPDADEPQQRVADDSWIKTVLLEAARKAGLRKATIDFIDENFGRDAAFGCPECGTEIIAWALAHPICPECNHESMKRKLIVAK